MKGVQPPSLRWRMLEGYSSYLSAYFTGMEHLI
jgi:hypothetical protein